METRVPGVSYDTGLREEDKDAEKEENGKTEEENIQRRRTLTEEFGSKQKKRKVNSFIVFLECLVIINFGVLVFFFSGGGIQKRNSHR